MRIFLFVILFATVAEKVLAQDTSSEFRRTLNIFYDSSRQRKIPFAIYEPVTKKVKEVVILNHGYAPESPDAYLAYSYLADFLAGNGYLVISIQHDLPGDPPIPREGNLQVLRMPFWESGVRNINYVINDLERINRKYDFYKLILIGHSMGGDIAALYASKNPKRVSKLITLDNRRVALPRTKRTRVLSLRSADQPADEGVLPSEEEARKFEMTIIKLSNTNHNEMDDDASAGQRKEILEYIAAFLKT